MIQWAEEKPVRQKILCLLNRMLPLIFAAIYIFCLILCLAVYPVLLLRLIFRPLLCFLTVTLIRYLLKFPRPYDCYNFKPLCGYHPGKNRSFPSRHTASAAIIALEVFHFWSVPGIVLIVLAVLMGVIRVLCGNHFIKDILAAWGIALIFTVL
jgi:membrane-associated phospholipid phosphatase